MSSTHDSEAKALQRLFTTFPFTWSSESTVGAETDRENKARLFIILLCSRPASHLGGEDLGVQEVLELALSRCT